METQKKPGEQKRMPKASEQTLSEVSKEESHRLWDAALKNVPDDY